MQQTGAFQAVDIPFECSGMYVLAMFGTYFAESCSTYAHS